MKKSAFLFAFSLLASQLSYADEDRLCLFRTCISPQKFLADFNDIVYKIKNFYAPLSFKEQKYNFTLEALANSTIHALQTSSTDAERIGNIKKFLANFHDAHISLEEGILHDKMLTNKLIPISVLALDDKYFVLDSELVAEGIESGDEIVSLDGQPVHEVAALIAQYRSTGHKLANFRLRASSIFYRPYFMTDVYPVNDLTTVRFKSKARNIFYDRALTWRGITQMDAAPLLTRLNKASPFEMGSAESFFLSPIVRTTFKMKNETQAVKEAGPNGQDGLLEAVVYKHQGKLILLVRQSTYEQSKTNPAKYLAAYRNLLRDFHDLVDVLVIDQTNNPGGSTNYAVDFFRLFSGKNARNLVFDFNADVGMLQNLIMGEQYSQGTEAGKRYGLIAKQLIEKMCNGENKGDAKYFPLYLNAYLEGDKEFQWEKPVLVLINELDVSSGDIVPLLFKENNRAYLFGSRTMGGGGNVVTLPSDYTHSGLSFGMTRSLFTIYREDGKYSEKDLVENQGVSPDFEYVIGRSDIENQFLNYVKSFSDAAASLTIPSTPNQFTVPAAPLSSVIPGSAANHTSSP